MRLLQCSNTGGFSLTKNLVGDNTIPPYAILSHTWLADTEEPTFEDLTNGTGEGKLGYKKIRFCGKQAKQDGIQYFWVDTCCIDKTSSSELSEAINSMFRWYKSAKVCYAYLSDVHDKAAWYPSELKLTLPQSRWFTRGWTLPELLAPSELRFFTANWVEIANTTELGDQISSITGIEPTFLGYQPVTVQSTREESSYSRKKPLREASVAQRMSWASKRQTTREEDVAYCLLGIFGVNMPLLYGEGKTAFVRLQEEIIKRFDDQSVFAWGIDNEPKLIETLPVWALMGKPTKRSCGGRSRSPSRSLLEPRHEDIGILAQSPADFEASRSVLRCGGENEDPLR